MNVRNLTGKPCIIKQDGQEIVIEPEGGEIQERFTQVAAKFGPLDIWEEWFTVPELPKPEKNTLLIVSKEICRHFSVRSRSDLVYYSKRESKLMVVRRKV